MSHSQFHSTNLFILRHAWLNLWDKHMTTGRINQVTTIRNAPEGISKAKVPAPFRVSSPRPEFVNESKGVTLRILIKGQAITAGLHSTLSGVQASPVANDLTTLFLDLTKFRLTSPCPRGDRDRGLRWGLPTTGSTWKGTQQSRRIPEWLFDWQVWPSASNPHPSFIASSRNKCTELDSKRTKSAPKALETSPVTFPKSVYPDRQVRRWLGLLVTSLAFCKEAYWTVAVKPYSAFSPPGV